MGGKPGAWAGGWEPPLEAVGSVPVLLCACLAHRILDWTPDGVAAVQGRAPASWCCLGGTLQYRGPRGRVPSRCLPCPSALPSGTVGALAQPVVCASSCLAAPLPPAEPPPPGSDPRRRAGSGPSGAGAPRSLGWRVLWLCLCILLALGPAGHCPPGYKVGTSIPVFSIIQ